MDYSCLNGWGFGNIASSARDVAKFFFEYLGSESMVSDSMKKIMMSDWEHGGGTDGFSFEYALGLMPLPYKNFGEGFTYLVGHAGMDWGSDSQMSGFNQDYNFSVVTTQGTIAGLDCDLKGKWF